MFPVVMKSTANYISGKDFGRILDAVDELDIRKWDANDIKMLFKAVSYTHLTLPTNREV